MRQLLKFHETATLAVVTSLTLLAAAPAKAGPGYALSFNGTNNHVWIDRPVSNDFSIEFWFNSTQLAGTNTQWYQGMGLVDGEVAGTTGDFGVSLGAGTVVFGAGGGYDTSIHSEPVADGKWHHVAATRVQASGLMRLYVDGALVASANGAPVTLDAPAQMRFGSLVTGMNYYRGFLDEVRIWSVARSQADIQAGMSQTPDLTDATLAGYWPFREGPGKLRTADISGHGYHGRVVNRLASVLSPVGWTPVPQFNGDNPITNECHNGFVEPGVSMYASPATIALGLFGAALKADSTVTSWGSQAGVQLTWASNVVDISVGVAHGLALKTDGTVTAWGDNEFGQVNVPTTATNIVAIAAGQYVNLAVKRDGTLVGWGQSYYGQLNFPASATDLVAIAAGDMHGLGLKANGTVVTWGDSGGGVAPIPASATNIVAIATGGEHNLALKANGTVVAWGLNDFGQANVPAAATNIVAIAAGIHHSLALKADGTVVAWGGNGEAGVPAWATNVVAIAASGNWWAGVRYGRSFVLRQDGAVMGWGDNRFEQIPAPESVSQLPFKTSGVVDVNSLGTYSLSYTYTNTFTSVFGNVSTTNRTVVVVDTVGPVVIPNYSQSYPYPGYPNVVRVGTPWVDPGATAMDACAGDISANVVATGMVNTNTIGYYTITYAANDPVGNIGTTTRLVTVADRPAMCAFSAAIGSANPITGTRDAQIQASLNPDGLWARAFFQYGLTTAYTGSNAWMFLNNSVTPTDVVCSLAGLAPGATYHWRVIATNRVGVTVSPDQTFTVPALYAPGDLNGDGVVDASEFKSVIASYWSSSPWVQLTNLAGLGGRNVSFALTNDLSPVFRVESSVNLSDWQLLGPAVPRYEFTDTNNPVGPLRFYRLRSP